MARIGMKYIACAPLASDGKTYEEGRVIARAINANVTLSYNDVILYADDMKVDSIAEFKEGKITLEGDYFSFENRELLLGHKSAKGMLGAGETLTYKMDDDGKFVGLGFYAAARVSGGTKYLAVWHKKVKFRETGETYETRGGGTSFQTPKLEGDILGDDNGEWKQEFLTDSEVKAKEWLNGKAQITGEGENG